jgi:prolyl-tRNA editing enzyme YbaK/EbsC (Cys-tRNA(Pro) deacylase)
VPEIPDASQPVLDAAAKKGVALEIVTFDESTHTAEEAARAVGAEVGQIVKSLVFVAERDEGPEPCLVLVSGANMVDISLLAGVLTEVRMRRATADEARAFTGFSIGGIPPFGHTRPIRTVMDPDLGRFTAIWAAAGTPNAVFQVTPGTLRMLANAVVAPIASAPVLPPEQPPSTEQPSGAAGAPSGA